MVDFQAIVRYRHTQQYHVLSEHIPPHTSTELQHRVQHSCNVLHCFQRLEAPRSRSQHIQCSPSATTCHQHRTPRWPARAACSHGCKRTPLLSRMSVFEPWLWHVRLQESAHKFSCDIPVQSLLPTPTDRSRCMSAGCYQSVRNRPSSCRQLCRSRGSKKR